VVAADLQMPLEAHRCTWGISACVAPRFVYASSKLCIAAGVQWGAAETELFGKDS
jgi:hypothetical protein